MRLEGLVYRLHFVSILSELTNNSKFLAVQIITDRLKKLYNTRLNNSQIATPPLEKSVFAQQILFNLIDSNLGFLGCIKSGAFYSSFHHLRFTLELYATVNYCFEDANSSIGRLRRYIFYPDIVALSLKEENLENPSNEDRGLIELFNTNVEGIKSIDHWHSEKNDQVLIEKLNEVHQKTYQHFCHYTHLSPLRFRSELPRIGFPPYWEENCTLSLKYTVLVCITLMDQGCLEKDLEKELEDIIRCIIKDIPKMDPYRRCCINSCG